MDTQTGPLNHTWRTTVSQYYFQLPHFSWHQFWFCFQWQCVIQVAGKIPVMFQISPKVVLLTYISSDWGLWKSTMNITATASVLEIYKHPALPAGPACKKADTWGQHNTTQLVREASKRKIWASAELRNLITRSVVRLFTIYCNMLEEVELSCGREGLLCF